MNLNIVRDDGTIIKYEIVKEKFTHKVLKNKIGYIGTQSKESNALNIFNAYFSEAKAILLDETNRLIVELLKQLNVKCFESDNSKNTLFDDKDFSFMYFTSGSTGYPVGALKSKENIISEINALTLLLEKYAIKKVIVTVPFIHLY
ncbi:MAG: aconitate hydratase, partial [Epsilonproteobacteria bacterium]